MLNIEFSPSHEVSPSRLHMRPLNFTIDCEFGSHFEMPYSKPEQSETKMQTDRFGAVASAGTFVASQCKRCLHMRTISSLKLRNCIQHSNLFSLIGYLHVPFSYDYNYPNPIPKHYLQVDLQVIRIPGRQTPLLIFYPS